ncbi:MAG TPA: helix-turn-helix transcriptional regulator [Candidatus Dormibacteraeota bacterium]|nr:helix-turn-helix transcriptional regulator [Candidatus Dormibacteraeota bacterium]
MAQPKHPIDLRALDHALAIRGWTKSDLAQHAGLSRDTVATIWTTGTATVRVLRAIATALEAAEPDQTLAALARRAS